MTLTKWPPIPCALRWTLLLTLLLALLSPAPRVLAAPPVADTPSFGGSLSPSERALWESPAETVEVLQDSPVETHYPTWKYFLDRAVIAAAAPVVLPTLGAISLLILLHDGGPVLFTQERAGLHGKPFRIYKFRTMHAGSSGPNVTVHKDPRITTLGAWLRRTHLDELPQLWNVLQGEMTLVGPRPHSVVVSQELQSTVPCYANRFAVLPGITGPGQIYLPYCEHGHQECSRALLDQGYVKSFSFWGDIRILMETLYYVARGHGTR